MGNLIIRAGATTAYVVWRVQGLELVTQVGKSIATEEFTVGRGEVKPSKWRLELYPLGYDEKRKNYLALFLHSLNTEFITATFSLRIYDKTGLLDKHDFENHVFRVKTLTESYGAGRAEFLPSSSKLNELVVICYIKIGDTENLLRNWNLEKFMHQSRESLWKMQSQNDLTDIDIKCGEEGMIQCHKVVLAAGSKVFRSMLMNRDNLESQSNSIFSSFGFQCTQMLVQFLYLDKLNMDDSKTKEVVKELVTAADYYDLPKLKNICQMELMRTLNLENVFEVLELASDTNCKKLMQKCGNFIKANGEEIDDEHWKKFLEGDSDRVIFLMKKIVAPSDENLEKETDEEAFFDFFWQLFIRRELTDATIRYGEKILPYHQVILKANAPIFHKLLLKSDTSKINFSFECLMEMLEYVYTGKLENSKEILELLQAAKDFEILYLKQEFEHILLRNLDSGNAVDYLEAGWKCDCQILKEKAMEVILETPKLLSSREYKDVLMKNSGLFQFTSKLVDDRLKENWPSNGLKVVSLFENWKWANY